ncbi:putative ATP-dependent RNA helicase TDRD12 [Calliopsis andreniformis]|uniref:putative ATP-dependent RNA helicase TDRD12 n=1 Tax=Calliopsis andreniformis TaxID=337506 RepID=UPI003FCE7687
MMIKKFDTKDIILPPTAVAVKVTNILTPYTIRIYEINDYEEKINTVIKKLLLLKKRGIFNIDTKSIEPKIGDTVLVHNKSEKTVELPAWLCRGIICDTVDKLEDTYNVLLSDYGICVKLQKEDFIPCSLDLISGNYLSFTVGLYNVLPVAAKYDPAIQRETLTVILDEWSTSTIEYIKELVSASRGIYFDHLVSDEDGKHYGEFYLNIEDTIISLSEALVLSNCAVYVHKELSKFIKNPKSCQGVCKKVIDNETIFYINVSKEIKDISESSLLDRSYIRKADKLQKQKCLHNGLTKEKEKILIYGAAKYECLNSVSDARLPANVHKAWSSLVQSPIPKKIQSYMWPAIKKGLDVIAIGPAKSGKTFGYGFPVCGLLAMNSNIPPGVNPSALILCSSSAEVLEIHSLCIELLQNCLTIRSVAAINGKSERTLAAEMFNGCQILITTPRFLVRFMNKNKKLLNFQNLRFLILDNGDIILSKYFDSILKLFKKHKIICNRESENKNIILQIIITAQQWAPSLKKFAYALMDDPYICITSFIEAAVFKSIHPKVYILNSKNKEEKTLDLLSDEYCKMRTIIVCINANEAEKLSDFLKKHKEILLAHENMNFIYLQGIKQYWNACISGSYPVLICTDDVLSDIDITNADWLIHYSISLRFKTQFNFRFSTLLNNLQMDKSSSCRVTIMADENNDMQFLSIVKIMQRMNVSISANMLQNIERIMITLDKKKRNYPMCNNIKSWGFCPEQSLCALRHGIISEIDAPNMNIRINDKVKFRVISVNDVNYVTARIISYIKFDTLEEIDFSNVEYVQVTMKIQEFYSNIENRKRCEAIDIGSICGLEEPLDSFKRVQILYIERENKTDNPKFVDIKCIDSGTILTKVHAYRLLHMPEEFVKYPTQIVEVFLVGVTPHDEEYVWNNHAVNFVCHWFKENVDERSYVIGTVKLHLKDTIWVDTLEIGTKLIGYKDLVGFSLKGELLKQDYAIENDKHLNRMYELCNVAGFSEINGHDLNVLINRTV